MKKVLLALLMAVLLDPLVVHAAKPRSPLQASISPVQSGLVATAIKPGDTVEFKIVGKAFTDTGELNIKVELHGGVELLSGETSWTGPAKKGEDKTLLITVRAPKHGNGGIKARVTMPLTTEASFSAEAEYLLGKQAQKKPAPLPAIKKDNKGREIREYRVN